MRIAIAKVTFQWDAEKVRYRDSGSGLYKDIVDFWSAKGLVAEIVDVLGNSGEKVIVLSERLEDGFDKKNQIEEPQVGIKQKLVQMKDTYKVKEPPKSKVLTFKKKKIIITKKK